MTTTTMKERTVNVWIGERQIYTSTQQISTNLIEEKHIFKTRLNSLRDAMPGAEIEMLVADMWEDDQGNVREQVYDVGSDSLQNCGIL